MQPLLSDLCKYNVYLADKFIYVFFNQAIFSIFKISEVDTIKPRQVPVNRTSYKYKNQPM